MKVHLPLPLFRSLMSVAAAAVMSLGSANAAMMLHESATLVTYADFGQNAGRYVTGAKVNGLLDYIRRQEGGVTITYIDGTPSNILEHGMIDFSSVLQEGATGAGNLIAPNAVITAGHNREFNPMFTNFTLGTNNAIQYQGIEYRDSRYLEISTWGVDVKMTRLNKLATDVLPANYYSGATTAEALSGQTIYHSGAGRQYRYISETNSYWWVSNPYIFISGGATVTGANTGEKAGSTGVIVAVGDPALSEAAPLPYQPQDGDSGSPIFIWDTEANQYAYVGSLSAVNALGAYDKLTTYSKAIIDPTLPAQLDAFTDLITPAAGTHHLDIMSPQFSNVTGGSITETLNNTKYTATSYYAKVIDMDVKSVGQETSFRFNHLDSSKDVYTWQALNGVMNENNWYHYGTEYMNLAAQSAATSADKRTWSELYASRNNRFVAKDTENYNICFSGIMDMGLGYIQVSKEDGVENASFTLRPYTSRYGSVSDPTAQVLTSGYIVDKDVTLHLQFNNPENYVREWRKVGEGTLSVEGTGDNWVLLNVGGAGRTELNRTNGFAAYNVLANTGSTVVLSNVNQIARDFTFGNGGAVLDFNGNSMTWNNGAKVTDDGFTIHALTEEALITNGKADSTATLTVTNAGKTYLGSFSDEGEGALSVIFNGGAGSSLTLHGIHTDLSHHDDSGMTVQSGTVVLAGTNTVHAAGSATTSNSRDAYRNADDWHYADAATDIAVQSGATFELGSHARLTGDVTVAEGGAYIMHEGVRHAQEYVEGGQVLEDTDKYSAFYGHKGGVKLDGGTMAVRISAETDKEFSYDGPISGTGKVSVETGNAARVLLGGNNTMSGANEVTHGTLVATGTHSLGNGTWDIQSGAVLAAKEFENKSSAEILASVDTQSQGVLALMADHAEVFDMSAHQQLVLGALADKTVHYGSSATALTAQNGQWKLGGAGGTLVVESQLNDAATLVLGDVGSTGTVVLNHTDNILSGVTVADAADMKLRGSFSLNDGGSITTGETSSLSVSDGTIHSLGTASVNGNVFLGNVVTTGDLTIGGTVTLTGELHAESGTVTFRDAVVNIDNGCVERIGYVYGSGEDVTKYALNANGFRGEAVRVVGSTGLSGNYVLEGSSIYSYGGLIPTISGKDESGTTAIQLAGDKVYYANTGVVTVGGSSATAQTETASRFHVSEGGILKVSGDANSTLKAAAVIETATGTGTMQLATAAELGNGKTSEVVNFGGTVELLQGAHLYLGKNGNYVPVNTSAMKELVLKGGSLTYGATGEATLRALTADVDSTLAIGSTGSAANDSHRLNIETLRLNAELDVKTTFYSAVKVGQLQGVGDLILSGASDTQYATASKISVDSLDGFSGTIKLSRSVDYAKNNKGSNLVITHADINAGEGAVALKGVTLASGATATITAENKVDLGAVDVSVNELGGDASVLTVKGAGFTANSAELGAGSVSLQEGAEFGVKDLMTVAAAEENGTASLTGGSMKNGRISGLTVTNAAVSLKDRLSYTIEDMQMHGVSSSLTVESGEVAATNSALHNLTLGRTAAVHGSGVTVTGDCHVEVAATPVPLMTLAAESEETPIVLYSDQLSGVRVANGAMLTLDIDSILPQLTPTTTQYTLVFTDLTWETTEDLKPFITLQYGSWGDIRELEFVSATQDDKGTYLNLSIQAPEPATATLSLLALAGLAARRRRR